MGRRAWAASEGEGRRGGGTVLLVPGSRKKSLTLKPIWFLWVFCAHVGASQGEEKINICPIHTDSFQSARGRCFHRPLSHSNPFFASPSQPFLPSHNPHTKNLHTEIVIPMHRSKRTRGTHASPTEAAQFPTCFAFRNKSAQRFWNYNYVTPFVTSLRACIAGGPSFPPPIRLF